MLAVNCKIRQFMDCRSNTLTKYPISATKSLKIAFFFPSESTKNKIRDTRAQIQNLEIRFQKKKHSRMCVCFAKKNETAVAARGTRISSR